MSYLQRPDPFRKKVAARQKLVPPVAAPAPVDPVVLGLQRVQDLLAALLDFLTVQYDVARADGYIDFNPNGTINNLTVTALYPVQKTVKRAVIMNISSTDNYTVFSSGSRGHISPGTAKQGIILNKAPASGQAGGSLAVGNVDLSVFSVISDTGANQNIAVYYER